jgi:hypothetical protein
MNKTERQPFFDAVENVLNPLGFKKRKADFEWNRKIDNLNKEWIHLNFGRGLITPSFGVEYLELSGILSPEVNCVTGVMKTLKPITGHDYNIETSPKYIADDIVAFGLPELLLLRNRKGVIKALESDNVNEWPVFGYSHRIRLLPLLLWQRHDIKECLSWLSLFEQQSISRDQIIPKYEAFAKELRAKVTGDTV